ncbi:hypothetical protein VM1G_11022 [Cytospora mali]|uniref:Major facilitator superfamily (MFS) profile domain-containing protein n=1 Tax=Cytospora mali TaxID=578113 RepID=A0A194VJR7_CYTMA|nr:hypothetical protein VM1G_11022 [Valsa mali]
MATTTATTTTTEIPLQHLHPRHDSPGPGEAASKSERDCDVTGIATGDGSPAASENGAVAENMIPLSKTRSAAIMATLACVSFLNTFNTGALTAGLPVIAKDLDLPSNLLLWPASVYALALSCTLLLMGAVADVVGSRPVFLAGSLLYTAWTIAVSLSQTGSQLIIFRNLQGIAMAFCMPSAVSTITTTFPSGKSRNLAFAVFGGGNPLGFAFGLVLGGVLVEVSSWHTAYYMAAAMCSVASLLAYFNLPKPVRPVVNSEIRHRLIHEFDWVGVVSASVCLGLLSYIFSEITYSGSVMAKPYNIILLLLSALLIPFFVWWEGYQERRGRPAILPNSIWQRCEFTAVCATVFLVWCWFNAYGYWCTLFFQEIQDLNALEAALRFLPLVVVGIVTNIVASMVMDKISAGWLALMGGLLSLVSPLLFALQDPTWSYWKAGFPAMVLSVVSTDLLFNISSLVITTNFPSKNQALAGGVFNTVTQLGNSIGLAVTAMIAASVTESVGTDGADTSGVSYNYAELKGYRAAFWTCFAAAAVSTVISTVGLRNAGKVGEKKNV